jgi:hypothetical protein
LGAPYANAVHHMGLKESMVELFVDRFGDIILDPVQSAVARGQLSTKSVHVLVPGEIFIYRYTEKFGGGNLFDFYTVEFKMERVIEWLSSKTCAPRVKVGFKVHKEAFGEIYVKEIALHVVIDSLDDQIAFLEYFLFGVAGNKDVGVVGVEDELTIYGTVDDVIDVDKK